MKFRSEMMIIKLVIGIFFLGITVVKADIHSKNFSKFNGYIDEKKKQINSLIGKCSQPKGTLKKATCMQLRNTFPHRMVCVIGNRYYKNRQRQHLFTDYMRWQVVISSFDRFNIKWEFLFHIHYSDGTFDKKSKIIETSDQDPDIINNLLSDGSFTFNFNNNLNERHILNAQGLTTSKFKFNNIYNTFEFEQTFNGMVFHSGVCEKRL